jgi:hypothetical protein
MVPNTRDTGQRDSWTDTGSRYGRTVAGIKACTSLVLSMVRDIVSGETKINTMGSGKPA